MPDFQKIEPHACLHNLTLGQLSPDSFDAVKPLLRRRDLIQGDTLFMPGEEISELVFVTAGAISLVTPLSSGETIEFAMVGRDGVVGGMAAMGAANAIYQAIVQIPGEAYMLDVGAARRLLPAHGSLQSALIRYEQFLLSQSQQSSACNATHNLEQRFARWLLRVRDATGKDTFRLTQDFMSDMLGVRRTSVTLVAGKFQQAGWISYVRGQIRLEKPDALERFACECHRALKADYEILLGGGGREARLIFKADSENL